MSDLYAVVVTLAFILAGLAFVVATKRLVGLESVTLTVSLLIVPFLVFLAASGRLGQFEGFGIKASFREAAERPVARSAAGEVIIRPDEPSLDAITRLEQANTQLGLGASVVFFRADRQMSLSERGAKALLIKNSIMAGSLLTVAVVDGRGRALGHFRPSWFLDLIPLQLDFTHYPDAGEPNRDLLRRQLMQTRFWDIVEAPEMRAEAWGSQVFIAETATVADAFRTLRDARTDVAVVTNHRGQYRGVVTADALLQTLVQALLLDTSRTQAR